MFGAFHLLQFCEYLFVFYELEVAGRGQCDVRAQADEANDEDEFEDGLHCPH